MLALLDQTTEPIQADEEEARIARVAAERLRGVALAKQDIQIVVKDSPNIVVPLPAKAVEIILRVLVSMADQKPVSVIPHEAELTTQQAADYLNVSRPFLIGLLDQGKIPHRLVGRHRRVRFADLHAFDMQSRNERSAALEAIAAEARRLDLD